MAGALLRAMNQKGGSLKAMNGEPIKGLWIGDRLSTMEQLSISSFLRHGHPFHLYTYGEIQGIPKGTTVLDANEILPASSIFAYRSGRAKGSLAPFADMFRYKMLFEQGGWWVDLDVVAIRPFDFRREYVFGREDGAFVAIGVVRVPPGSELMRQCCDQALRLGAKAAWGQTGPRLFTLKVRELGLFDQAEPPAAFYPFTWRQVKALVYGRTPMPSAESTYAIHLWHEIWRRARIDPDATFALDSLYERLRRDLL